MNSEIGAATDSSVSHWDPTGGFSGKSDHFRENPLTLTQGWITNKTGNCAESQVSVDCSDF